ncbi:Pirin [hydrothermal vent metagenome]|uniref:Pirin n=1 Tax=hydrothermal vent metagenome TaxID=652676 RepID=A0A3B1A2K1_9ZZZZ
MTAISTHRTAKETMEGDGVTVRRLMPISGFMNFDPFALWDHFTIQPSNGFPDHPHRGFEAITYVFSGSMNHTDNLGNSSTVNSGGAQRFTAGSGIIHSEMPGEQGETTGIQLWINLPQRLKSIAPDYQQVDALDIPQGNFKHGIVRYIVGQKSPLILQTEVEYRDIQFTSAGDYLTEVSASYQGFIYIAAGQVTAQDKILKTGDALFLSQIQNLSITGKKDARVMFCIGLAHGEKMHQHGSYVD